MAHRVAGREGGGDDGRAEHQPDDDQGAAGPSAAHVAHAEAEEDAVADRQGREPCDDDREDEDECGGEAAHRDAEQLAHAYLLRLS